MIYDKTLWNGLTFIQVVGLTYLEKALVDVLYCVTGSTCFCCYNILYFDG